MNSNKKKGRINKNKGSNAERYYAKKFREDLGFEGCITTRQGSRYMDDLGIDLMNIPFNVQIKAGVQRGLNPSSELRNIYDRINKSSMVDLKNKPLVLIHKKQVGRGKKADKFDELVSMSFEDFSNIIKKD